MPIGQEHHQRVAETMPATLTPAFRTVTHVAEFGAGCRELSRLSHPKWWLRERERAIENQRRIKVAFLRESFSRNQLISDGI
jgi:hypothetical protein